MAWISFFKDSKNEGFKNSPDSQNTIKDFVVIDLETTGLSTNSDKLIQISAVRFRNLIEADCFSTYVCPSVHIPPHITRLTGISDTMVESAPTFEDVWPQYKKFVEESPLVTGYNVSFDLQFLSKACGEDLRSKWKCFDTLSCARQAIPCLTDYKLSTVCNYINYSDRFHDSLNDCRACGEVIKYLCNYTDYFELESLTYLSPCKKHRNGAQFTKVAEYKSKLAAANPTPISPDKISKNGPLAGKNIVFTGVLSFGRSTALLMAETAGAFVKSSVSKKTDYVVVGEQDIDLVGSDGLSSKLERAYQLIDEYGIDIKIIGEVEFLRLLTAKEGSPTNG